MRQIGQRSFWLRLALASCEIMLFLNIFDMENE